jgi:hypothetical protein
MIGRTLVFVVLAFQQKKAVVLAESAEHKFLVAKIERIGLLLIETLKAENECTRKALDGSDHASANAEKCDRLYKPIHDKIDAETDLVNVQLAKVDECKKTYRTTIDKKTSDLTVREATAVKACQALALYPLDMSAKEKE